MPRIEQSINSTIKVINKFRRREEKRTQARKIRKVCHLVLVVRTLLAIRL